jgi:hypothetical protein
MGFFLAGFCVIFLPSLRGDAGCGFCGSFNNLGKKIKNSLLEHISSRPVKHN